MREVPPADGLAVVERNDIANDLLRQHEVAKQDVVRAVPQNMADGEYFLRGLPLERVVGGEAVIQGQSQWFFAEDVQLERRDGLDDFNMRFVQRADEDSVHAHGARIGLSNLASPFEFPVQPLSPISEFLALGGVSFRAPDEILSELFALERVGVGDGMDHGSSGISYGFRISIATGASSDDEEAQLSRFRVTILAVRCDYCCTRYWFFHLCLGFTVRSWMREASTEQQSAWFGETIASL